MARRATPDHFYPSVNSAVRSERSLTLAGRNAARSEDLNCSGFAGCHDAMPIDSRSRQILPCVEQLLLPECLDA